MIHQDDITSKVAVNTPPPLTLVRDTMQLLSGRWKMQIIVYLLIHGTTRFMDLQRGIAGISPRILSKDLQELEQSSLVARRAKDAKLSSVDYELTDQGMGLEPVIQSMLCWGARHFE